jgi:hypothetical protein
MVHCIVKVPYSTYRLLSYNSILKRLEDNKGATRSCQSKKDSQYNGQRKMDKMTNIDIQHTTQKTKDRGTRTLKKPAIFLY